MVSTRGKQIKFDKDSSTEEDEFEDGTDVELSDKPASKRRKIKRTATDDQSFILTSATSPAKKKGKPAVIQNQLITIRGGRGGKLRDLMNMPIDIFTEICFNLDPYDLRRLSLTCKRLHRILMTKEARHVWKTAIASVPDLPECPTDLNEPQYVFLLYSSECYTIGCTTRGTKPDWFHRVRFCVNCHQSKMAEGWEVRNSHSELGIKQETIAQIEDYFSSASVMDRSSYYLEAIKKAGSEYEALPQEGAEEYLSNLGKMRDYKVETGRAMMEWKKNQLSSRADDIEAVKEARSESIIAKLLELGWERRDLPTDQKEFKELLFKNQKLTPKVWQNIRPRLEVLLEAHRNERLESEKAQRRRNREDAIRDFYPRIARETLGRPFGSSRVVSILPEIEEVFTLPSVKSLLDSDTETITEEELVGVAPDVRYILVKWWRGSLKQLLDSLEHGSTAQPNDVSGGDGGAMDSDPDPENDTEEAISDSIKALTAKLSYATSVFHCDTGWCRKISWFPEIVQHGVSYHGHSSISELLRQISPLKSDGQRLVRRLLTDLGLDPETVRSEVLFEKSNQRTFQCARCDESVAISMNFGELIEHYIEKQRSFGAADEDQNSPPSDPPQAENSESSKIVHGHDWASQDALFTQQDKKALPVSQGGSRATSPWPGTTRPDAEVDLLADIFATQDSLGTAGLSFVS